MTPAQPALDAMMEGVRELRDFLNGDGQMRGKSFGDRNAVGHAFWWRGQLYRLDQVMEAVPPSPPRSARNARQSRGLRRGWRR
jgi:hypothetical protein